MTFLQEEREEIPQNPALPANGNLGRWLILRTSGGRTLPLARSLTAAGFEAWTPVARIKRRSPGGRSGRQEHDVPLMPTIVFAQEHHLVDLIAAARLEDRSHPPFSLFRHLGRYPLVSDREVERLREAERRSVPRSKRTTFSPGSIYRPTAGAYTGMDGVIVSSTGKQTVIDFGSWMKVTIDTFAIDPTGVRTASTLAGKAA